MANSYYLYLDLRYIGCIVRIIEKIRIDKITGVQGTSYTCGLSPQKGLQMRGQSRIRTGVYGFADHRLNHSSNRPHREYKILSLTKQPLWPDFYSTRISLKENPLSSILFEEMSFQGLHLLTPKGNVAAPWGRAGGIPTRPARSGAIRSPPPFSPWHITLKRWKEVSMSIY